MTGQEEKQPKGYDLPAVCNVLLPGFGVGSFIQGDWIGGTIQTATQLMGLGCLGIANAIANESGAPVAAAYYWEIAGFGIFVVSRVYGFLQPFCYAEHFNEKYDIADEAQQRSSLDYMILNTTVPGFGTGSFVQGDRLGSTVQLIVEAVGVCSAAVSFFANGLPDETRRVLYAVGGCCFGGARFIWGPFRPIWYAARNIPHR